MDILQNIDCNNIPDHHQCGEKRPCKVVRVVDGDTIKVVGLYNDQPILYTVRIRMVDSPETKTKNLLEKEAGLKVKDYVTKLLENKVLYFRIEKQDKWGGRVVGDIFLSGKKNSLSRHLRQNGLVKTYTGNKKEEWTDKQLKEIIANIP